MKRTVHILIALLFCLSASAQTISFKGYKVVLSSAAPIPDPTPLVNVDSISGQYVWQADVPSDVVRTGSTVTSWKEKLSGSQNFTATNPTYFATGGANNLPYISLSVGNSLNLTPSPVTTTPATYYMLVRTPLHNVGSIFSWDNPNGDAGAIYLDSVRSRVYTGLAPYNSKTLYSLRRNTWYLLKVKVVDNKNFWLEVNDEPTHLLAGDVTGTPLDLDYFKFLGDIGVEVAEVRLFNRDIDSAENKAVKDYFIDKYALAEPNKKIMVLGDSHTYGVQSGSPANTPYLPLYAASTTYSVYDYGYSGASTWSTGFNVDLPAIYHNFNKGKWSDYWVVFNYGSNDAGNYNGDWTAWKANYKAIIQTFIDSGFDPQKIVIVTPPYSEGIFVRDKLPIIRTAITEIATELNLRLADWCTAMENAGLDAGSSANGGDGIHTNDAGHQIMSDILITITGT